jgi:hypothetical protein
LGVNWASTAFAMGLRPLRSRMRAQADHLSDTPGVEGARNLVGVANVGGSQSGVWSSHTLAWYSPGRHFFCAAAHTTSVDLDQAATRIALSNASASAGQDSPVEAKEEPADSGPGGLL